MTFLPPRWRIGLALFVAIATVRLSLVLYMATPLPFYDEWPQLIDGIARPMLTQTLRPGAMLLATHNEHVLAPTRLLEWGLLRANDLQFDNTLACALNQVLRAALAALLIVLALPLFPRRSRWFVCAATAFVAIPYDWENIGMGFANSYFLLAGFSILAIVAATRVRRLVSGTIGLVAFALLADVSMGSGFFAAAIAVAIMAMRWRTGDLRTSATLVFAAALIACGITGAALTWRATGGASIGALQVLQIVLVLCLWIPTGILGYRCLGARTLGRFDLALLGVSLWGLAEILAILALRPEFRLWLPISRYMEILGIGAFANLGCLMRVADTVPSLRGFTRWALPAFAGAIVLGAPFATHWFEWRAGNLAAQAQRVERYIRQGDTTALTTAPATELPFPSSEYLRAELDAADVRYILGDVYGMRPRPAPLTAFWRGFGADLRAWRFAIWPAMALLAWGLLPPSWRRRRCATIPG
ncbi:MAG: hypothetical protein JSS28_10480 [Proteobacteria bacterium]|nr:hypothetical protein [Pseudomonadota bacterium]